MINICEMSTLDIDEVVNLEINVLGETLGKEMFIQELKSKVCTFLVAKFENKIVGYISAYVIDGEIEVLNFAVALDMQRKGIGSMLFDDLINRTNNLSKITLEVRDNNLKGISFYTKKGLEKIGIREHYYSNGDNAIIMMKEYKI